MPRPLKNNEINDRLSELKTALDIQKSALDKQTKVNIVFGFLYVVLLVIALI